MGTPGILPVTNLPGWPAPPPGILESLSSALQTAGIAGVVTIAPDGLHVPDVTTAQSFLSTYVGSAAELSWAKSNAQSAGKFDKLNAVYLGKFVAGFNYTGPDGVTRTFQIDPQSQFNIDVQANASLGAMINSVALVTVSGSGLEAEIWDANSYFIAADNSHMPLPTARDMRTFALAVRAYVSGLILHNRALKDAIGGATDVKTLDTIDINLGWPSNP